MHSSGRAMHFKNVPKHISNRIDQRIPSRAKNLAHLSHVPAEMALFDKICENFLVEIRREDIHCQSDRCEMFHQVAWNDDVADTQRWKQNLAEGADINYARVH